MEIHPKPASPSCVRFGAFELNLQTRELLTENKMIPLQDQPYRVLVLLLESAGQIATREEIQGKLWPNDTTVDFEHGINAAVKNLRRALSDSPESPIYIQTLPRLGYKLLVTPLWVQSKVPATLQGYVEEEGRR